MQEKWVPHRWQARSFSPWLLHVRLVILVGPLSYAAAVADGVLSLINLLMFPVAESLDHSFISFLCLSLLPPFCLFLVLHLPRLHISSRSSYTCISKVLVKKLCYASKPLRAQQVDTIAFALSACSAFIIIGTKLADDDVDDVVQRCTTVTNWLFRALPIAGFQIQDSRITVILCDW